MNVGSLLVVSLSWVGRGLNELSDRFCPVVFDTVH